MSQKQAEVSHGTVRLQVSPHARNFDAVVNFWVAAPAEATASRSKNLSNTFLMSLNSFL